MIGTIGRAIAKEPPFRQLVKLLMKMLPVGVPLKALWDAADRPQYLFGVFHAAEQARREGHDAVSVIEFGVAEGYGLLSMQSHAAAVERHTGVRVYVYGFDSGRGLPKGTGDYRDHPDVWKAGDYQIDEMGLRKKLEANTTLFIGDVSDTVLKQPIVAPVGFIAFDLDLYSSTSSALRLLLRRDVALLRRVALYFDDINAVHNHRFAGELLAIDEFNRASDRVKVDRWRGIQAGRPFPEADWLMGMYLAHNIALISEVDLKRPPARMR
jgi:hypothetical protein